MTKEQLLKKWTQKAEYFEKRADIQCKKNNMELYKSLKDKTIVMRECIRDFWQLTGNFEEMEIEELKKLAEQKANSEERRWGSAWGGLYYGFIYGWQACEKYKRKTLKGEKK
jgi:hypothetical protein